MSNVATDKAGVMKALLVHMPYIDQMTYGKDESVRRLAIKLTVRGIKEGIDPFAMFEGAADASHMASASSAAFRDERESDDDYSEVDELVFFTDSLPWDTGMSLEFAAACFGFLNSETSTDDEFDIVVDEFFTA